MTSYARNRSKFCNEPQHAGASSLGRYAILCCMFSYISIKFYQGLEYVRLTSLGVQRARVLSPCTSSAHCPMLLYG